MYWYLLTVLLALISCPSGTALDVNDALAGYGRQTWQTENGLPQNTVHAIVQSRDGFLWVATEGGLARFDGLRFRIYDSQNTPALKSNLISSLLEDRQGTLWIGTAEGLTSLNGDVFHTYTTEDGLPADKIWALDMDGQGTLWASTAAGLARFTKNRFVEDAQAGANVFDDSRLKGLGTIAGLSGSRINTAFRDKEGALWIGTDSGLVRVLRGRIERLSPRDPLSTEAILSITEDREGDLWIGTDSAGLTILRNQKFATYTFREGNGDEQVRCVFQDHSGVVWIGTNGDGLKRFEHGVFSAVTTTDGLSSNIILALAEDKQGTLLVGTPDGLNRIGPHGISVLTSADGLAEDFVRSIYVDSDGSFWVGTRRGLSHVNENAVTTYTQSNGLGSDLVGAMLRDRHNDLWIATLDGLSRFQNRKFTNYTVEDGLPGNVITDLYADSEGYLWIATQDAGLARFRDNSFVRFPSRLKLPGTIYGIAEDANANLWLAAKTGIFRVSRRNLNAFAAGSSGSVNIASYGTSDGLRVSECSGGGHPAIWKDRDGSIWFATAKGAAVLKANHVAINPAPPPVALESIFIDDKPYDPDQVKDIAPGHSRVSFEYAGLSFLSPHSVQFKYRLEGFDREWIDAGTRRAAYYTNLPPKQYRFRVIARNNDGVWNLRGSSISFRIQPHFYQTWWFRLLLLLCAALLSYGLYYWRVMQVRAQFNAVLQERNRIAREIHDTLAQGFAAVSLQLELVARLLSTSVDKAREHLDEARVLVRISLTDARQSIWELRSEQTEQPDFAGRFSKYARQVGDSSGLKVQFQVHGAYRPLSRSVEDELFRIGQEAVTNAVRHADAEHISIELNFDGNLLRMTIADDGSGFEGHVNSSGPDGHFGLKGMRERAENIHAKLNVVSAAGKGTKVYVEAPVK
ncbi:MAG: histidine kinase [Acidobacteriota bacterium]|nr:histidine kinase [Acidobacteriota bacterium]